LQSREVVYVYKHQKCLENVNIVFYSILVCLQDWMWNA